MALIAAAAAATPPTIIALAALVASIRGNRAIEANSLVTDGLVKDVEHVTHLTNSALAAQTKRAEDAEALNVIYREEAKRIVAEEVQALKLAAARAEMPPHTEPVPVVVENPPENPAIVQVKESPPETSAF